ncbi:ABC transporter permease [Candidatus Cyanaurora vandensis]|uniref:ABC transporter permease n=1 Tax=Candidatus Cyanaurora vandensis TaxID=2714958 RepID=UPI00257EF76D|nr:ABC transporter permease [Candidatus Cyanaurora vandensis]
MGNATRPLELPLAVPGLFSPAFWQETLALTRRWFIQLKRRPTALALGIAQPLMFLVLFGAAFHNAPVGIFGSSDYTQFLAAGVIIFTAFGAALNAGLPIVFDREFGFLNRILVAPLTSRLSVVFASAIYIVVQSLLQTAVVMTASTLLGAKLAAGLGGLLVIGLVVMLLVIGFTALSIGLAFVVPGHIEALGLLLVLNLPLLFASTALAPLAFMPPWLQWVATLNPLTWAIEPVRYLYSAADWSWTSTVLVAPWATLSLESCLVALLIFDGLAVALVGTLLRKFLA